jgi:hypothetical protein
MARARVCDRCNKTITGNDAYYAFGAYKYCPRNWGKEWRPDLEVELCDKCINDFRDFIKNNEEKL